MAIPNTKDGNVRFIADEPDWSQGFEVLADWRTKIITNRDDSEQRARREQTPKWSFTYALPNLAPDEASQRRSRQLRELGQLTVVPIWPFEMDAPALVFADQFAYGDHLSIENMRSIGPKIGGYLFFEEDGLTSVFRKIESFALTAGVIVRVNFVTGNAAFPNIAVPAYTTACLTRPCVTGIRVDNSGSMASHRIGWNDELIAVQEI